MAANNVFTGNCKPLPMNRNLWIDNLRAFITVLVVAHHAALAYTTFGHFDKEAYIRSVSPVVDNAKWAGIDIFVNFNDIFFMPLMFFISGLFVYSSILKKGRPGFLRDRILRLGLPFVIAVTVIIPFAYLPSYYLAHGSFSLVAFIDDYLTIEQWPVGPPWFIWVLLAFNILAVAIPGKVYDAAGKTITTLAKDPLLFFGTFIVLACIAYIPLSLMLGHYVWTGLGPFDFQLNRILLYFFFFLLGAFITSNRMGIVFKRSRLLGKSWPFWVILALTLFIAIEGMVYFGEAIKQALDITDIAGVLIFDGFFVASCLCSCFAFMAFFRKKANGQEGIWPALSANAYGVYLIHYVPVTWLQFALLDFALPAVIKFLLVFIGGFILSLIFIIFIRKIKPVGNII
jgi:glucan biosynthesis protein C